MNNSPDHEDDFFAKFLEESRKHALYFALSADKTKNELDVACILREEMLNQGETSFHSIRTRGRGNDPPDCEAMSSSGKRVGIEVTELVDEKSFKATVNQSSDFLNPATPSDVVEKISFIIKRKDCAHVRGGSYDQYILLIYCDDPRFLDYDILYAISQARFERTKIIDRAYFLTSYCPLEKCCPYMELALTINPPHRNDCTVESRHRR